MASNFNFDDLAVNKVATDQWVKLASSMYAPVEKTARVAKFLGALTGRGVTKATQVAGEAGRVVGETAATTAKARGAVGVATTKGAKSTADIATATRARDVAKADLGALGFGEKGVAKVKGLFGKGEYAKLQKSEAAIAKAKITGKPASEVAKASKSNLSVAEKAEKAAAKTKAQADKALATAKHEQSAARTGAGMVVGTGLLGAAALGGGGGGGRRGPVIVT
jgi:hypothetical protein